MPQTRHTPMPWYYDKEASLGGAPVIVSKTCWMGCRREVAKVLYYNGSEDPEVDYNAALIAAAPEMLELLHDVGKWLEMNLARGTINAGTANRDSDLVSQLRAIIHKATSR